MTILIGVLLQVMFLLLAFGLRSLLHWRQTGSFGMRGFAGRRSLAERLGVVLLVTGGALSVGGTVAGERVLYLQTLEQTLVAAVGAVGAAAALLTILVAQGHMGRSWRIGVDPQEVTELVTGGLFRFVRNPIFSAMLLFWVGIAAIVPNALTLLAPLVALVGIELQIRCVEEPYLLRTHGDSYRTYARRVGRLLPGLGRMRGSVP